VLGGKVLAMDLTTAIGSVAALCTTAAYGPQLKKCWQTGSAGDLSLRTFAILATGVALWTAYGVAKGDAVIIAANAASLALLGGILFFKLREQPAAAEGPAKTRGALLRSEERYRTVVDGARDYAIFTTDETGRVVDWYPGAAAVFGWSAEEVRGQPADLLFTPEDRARGRPAEELALARTDGMAPDIRWHQRKDGGRVFIEGKVVPIGGRDGSRGFLKIGQDVTARRRAERELRRSEERFSQFAEASSDVLWIRDAAGLQFEYVSAAVERVYGADRERISAGNSLRRWVRLIHPEDRRRALEAIRAVRRGERRTHEFRIRRPDGVVRWIRDTSFPLLDENGHVQRVAGIGRDFTGEKEASDRLEVMVSELQHRTRNVLAVIQALVETTRRETATVEEFQDRLGERLRALSRVQGMLSRLGEGEKITFDTLLKAELAAHGALGDSGRVRLEGPADVPLMSRNVQTFALALHELATNAVKHGAFASPSGQLVVRWRVQQPASTAELHVDWRETGVARRENWTGSAIGGYGRELIERALPYQLGARTRYQLESDGVHCTIEVPIVSD
jgi:PAS domain S-box-containing protein